MVDIICDHGESDGTENNVSYLAHVWPTTYIPAPASTPASTPASAPASAQSSAQPSASKPDYHTATYNDHIEVGKRDCPKILTEFQQQISKLLANYPARQHKYVDAEVKDQVVLHDGYCSTLSYISQSIRSPNSSLYTGINERVRKNDTTYYF